MGAVIFSSITGILVAGKTKSVLSTGGLTGATQERKIKTLFIQI